MRIYTAAKFARRFELRGLRDKLHAAGHVVTSRWLDIPEDTSGTGGQIRDAAEMDIFDIDEADCLVFFGEPQASHNRGGGRWWEFGYAYARGKPCVCVLNMDASLGGHDHLPVGHESVFTALADVSICTDADALVAMLDAVELIRNGALAPTAPFELKMTT